MQQCVRREVLVILTCLGCWLIIISTVRANSVEKSSGFSEPLRCTLTGSDDEFWFYPEQLIFRSDQFLLLQNFSGRVVTQVDLKTGEFYRTTVIGEPFRSQRLPDELEGSISSHKVQNLTGQCQAFHHARQWTVPIASDNLY